MKYLLFFIFASFSLITTAFCQSGEKENRSVGIISSDNELTNFLNQIEEEFNLEFAYDSNIRLSGINRNYQKKSSIRDMLTEIFEPGDIEFVIQDRTILLRNKKQMIKPVHISGVITDMTDGEPLPYSGLTDSFGKQFFSDSLGRFRLTYTEGALPESIRFSYMGYGTCILPIGHNETKMQIRLSRKAQRIPTINISSTMLPDIYPSYQ